MVSENKKTNVVEDTKTEKKGILSYLQKIGKSLVYPIAILPAAALLLRIGALIQGYGSTAVDASTAQVFLWWLGTIMLTPGDVVFGNLPLIFAIGIAFGFAKDYRGEAALVGGVAYFVLFGLVQNSGSSMATLFYSKALVNPLSGKSDLLYLTVGIPTAVPPADPFKTTWLLNIGVFGGIVSGLTAAWAYNRYHKTRLHPALGFFSGRRFVPMVVLIVMIFVAVPFALIWPWLQYGLIKMSGALVQAPEAAAGVYAFANRLLIPFGLHQVLNQYFWFQSPIALSTGEVIFWFNDSANLWEPLFGDITAFTSALAFANGAGISIDGGVTAITGDAAFEILQQARVGIYQTGFFPIFMFGLPAVGIAMAMKADKDKRKMVYAFVLSAAAVSFLTGITEPLEFAFMFISPVLYFGYALLSGGVAAATVATGASMGFGFSAGAVDFAISSPTTLVLSVGASSALNGAMGILWILIIGLISAPIYWGMAMILIQKAKIATPGRLGNEAGLTGDVFDKEATTTYNPPTSKSGSRDAKLLRMAENTLDIVGRNNLEEIDNCITRVRLTVKDASKYKSEQFIKIGYTGFVKVGKNNLQLIIGPDSEVIANYMKELVLQEVKVPAKTETSTKSAKTSKKATTKKKTTSKKK